jgi:hypothetical protein
MRLSLFVIAAAALGLNGCSNMISVNGFAPDNMMVQNPGLPGVWADGDSTFIVKAKDQGYHITMIEKGSTATTFDARLFRAGNAEILDLEPAGDDDPFRLKVHTPVRIWVDEHTLKFAWLDSKWLSKAAREQLTSQDVGDRLLVTSPGDELMKFLLLNGGDDRAYEGKINELARQ